MKEDKNNQRDKNFTDESQPEFQSNLINFDFANENLIEQVSQSNQLLDDMRRDKSLTINHLSRYEDSTNNHDNQETLGLKYISFLPQAEHGGSESFAINQREEPEQTGQEKNNYEIFQEALKQTTIPNINEKEFESIENTTSQSKLQDQINRSAAKILQYLNIRSVSESPKNNDSSFKRAPELQKLDELVFGEELSTNRQASVDNMRNHVEDDMQESISEVLGVKDLNLRETNDYEDRLNNHTLVTTKKVSPLDLSKLDKTNKGVLKRIDKENSGKKV